MKAITTDATLLSARGDISFSILFQETLRLEDWAQIDVQQGGMRTGMVLQALGFEEATSGANVV